MPRHYARRVRRGVPNVGIRFRRPGQGRTPSVEPKRLDGGQQKEITSFFEEGEKVGRIETGEIKQRPEAGDLPYPPTDLPPAPTFPLKKDQLLVERKEYSKSGEQPELLQPYKEYMERNYPPKMWVPNSRWQYRLDLERGHVVVVDAKTGEDSFGMLIEMPPGYEGLSRSKRGLSEAEKKAIIEYTVWKKLGEPVYESRAKKGKYGYYYEIPMTREERFLDDVERGRIRNLEGLPLSSQEVYGLPPAGGYLNTMVSAGKDWKPDLSFYPGLVVKITGDYREDLADTHNTYGIITKIIDPYRYEVVQEGSGDKHLIRDTDVKGLVGDIKHDFIGIGEERHQKEVVPLIKKALKGKIPVGTWERPSYEDKLNTARRMAARQSWFEDELKGGAERIKAIERDKDRYEPEDYHLVKNDTEEWLRAYKQVEEEIKRDGRDTVVERGWGRGS
jgi:hypothetical protein